MSADALIKCPNCGDTYREYHRAFGLEWITDDEYSSDIVIDYEGSCGACGFERRLKMRVAP